MATNVLSIMEIFCPVNFIYHLPYTVCKNIRKEKHLKMNKNYHNHCLVRILFLTTFANIKPRRNTLTTNTLISMQNKFNDQ